MLTHKNSEFVVTPSAKKPPSLRSQRRRIGQAQP
jgi:hypothetical protein